MSREDPQLKIRLPPDLKEQVEEASKAAGRTINAEVVLRLRQSFESQRRERPADFAEQQYRLHQAMSERAAVHAEINSLHVRLAILRMQEQQAPREERDHIREELDSLHRHLAVLERRRADLEQEIARARAALDQ